MDLKSLVQESRQLTNHILPTGLTPLERGLEQIEAQSARLFKRTTGGEVMAIDNRTAYLLASRGIDSERVLESMMDVNLGLTFEPLQGVADTDIELYLQNEHETLVSLAIEETRNATVAELQGRFENSLQKDWLRQKRKIMENMGHHSLTQTDEEMKGYNPDSQQKSGGLTGHKGGILAHPRLSKYAAIVIELNNARLKADRFNAIAMFRKASEQTGSDKQHEFISGCWELLAKMLGFQRESDGSLHAGYFRDIYSEASKYSSSDDAIKFRKQLVKGARGWLQDTFADYLSRHIREQQYELGGMPSALKEVQAYIKIKFYSNGRWSVNWLDHSIGKIPFWAHIYTLVRMGLLNEAYEYIQAHSSELQASRDSNFAQYFRAWYQSPDGRLPKSLRDSLIGEWNSRIRDLVVHNQKTPKGDAFKYALYKIIGRCELNVKTIRNSQVIRNTEDYLWLQTMLISEDISQNDSAYEKYTLADFGMSMDKFGKAYFQKTEMWFLVLLCSGRFEKAINELSYEPFFAADAIHFAIVLAYYGVLKVPSSPKAIPLTNTLLSAFKVKVGNSEFEYYEFHFSRMISQLVREWVSTDPAIMMHYVYLLGLFGKHLDAAPTSSIDVSKLESAKSYTKYALSLTKDILMESGKSAELIGSLRADGRGRDVGVIEKYRQLLHLSTEQEFLDRIVLASAEQSDEEARLKEALELYHLSGQPNKVLELLIREISESLQTESLYSKDLNTVDKTSLFNIEDPAETAMNVLNFYMTRSLEASMLNHRTVSTCKVLVSLAMFKKDISAGHFEAAIKKFNDLDIVPLSNDMNEIQRKASSFNSLDESVCRVLPSILVNVAQVYHELYQRISNTHVSEREVRLRELRTCMKSLLTFTGLITYQIPSEIFAKMNRLGVMMN